MSGGITPIAVLLERLRRAGAVPAAAAPVQAPPEELVSLREPDVSPAQREVYDEVPAFVVAIKRLTPFLRRFAGRIADGDAQLTEDLVQEALIALWELDPSRFGEGDQLYLKRALVRRMINAAEREFVAENLVPRSTLREYLVGVAPPVLRAPPPIVFESP